MNRLYSIELHGCDDATYITRELTPEQYMFLEDLAKQLKSISVYPCMPVMVIKEQAKDE